MGKYTIPKPKKLPSGNFRIQFQIDGKRYSVCDESKLRVKEKADKLYKDILAGIEQEKRNPLTVKKAMQQYIDSQKAVLSPATIAGYQNICNNHLKLIMGICVSDLTSLDIQKAISREVQDGKSPKSIRNYTALLGKVLATYRPNFHPDISLPQKEKYEAQILSDFRCCLSCLSLHHAIPVALLLPTGFASERTSIYSLCHLL